MNNTYITQAETTLVKARCEHDYEPCCAWCASRNISLIGFTGDYAHFACKACNNPSSLDTQALAENLTNEEC